MFNLIKKSEAVDKSVVEERPRLELSGPLLQEFFNNLLTGSEALGGVERYIGAIMLKYEMFQDAFKDGPEGLDLDTMHGMSAFMSTVRRRIGPYLESEESFAPVKAAIIKLFDGARDTTTTDQRMVEFMAAFPQDRDHRWVRDLASELLHHVDPERYPLMNRWVWDKKSNTGVIREIWHGDNVDSITIHVPDYYQTFIVLREELSGWLSENGVFRDMPAYVDLMCAQIYAEYICAQGGSYLRVDFSAPEDPMEHTRRLLGLDGVRPRGTTKLKTNNGKLKVQMDKALLE